MTSGTHNSIALRFLLPAVCLLVLPFAGFADNPQWWVDRGVVSTNSATTNDYAVANQGQLKWFATNAYLELEANLTGGAGSNVESFVQSLSSTNNYYPVNLGQLKYAAGLYFDRLIEEGVTNSYPWTTNTADDVDYAPVNLGQLKVAFDFDVSGGSGDTDGDGLLNSVETDTGVYVSPEDTGSDPNKADTDEDGIDDGDEVDARTDPNNADTNKPNVLIAFPSNDSHWGWIP